MLLASHFPATVNLIKECDHMLGILMDGNVWRGKLELTLQSYALL